MSIATRNLTDKDLNRFERKILKNVQKYGWHANGIPGEGTSPNWAYSVGLFAKYGQPELILFGLEVESMHEMIARYADLLQAGKEFSDGAKIDGIIPDKTCVLREVHVPWLEPLLRSASWYYHYEEYPVLQCFWPDRHGCFPWEDHCSKHRFAAEDAPREDNQTERIWVSITNVDDDYGYYTGVIDNEPIHSAAAYGDELQFHPLNIAEIKKKRRRWPGQSK